jgi:hypothetical protein
VNVSVGACTFSRMHCAPMCVGICIRCVFQGTYSASMDGQFDERDCHTAAGSRFVQPSKQMSESQSLATERHAVQIGVVSSDVCQDLVDREVRFAHPTLMQQLNERPDMFPLGVRSPLALAAPPLPLQPCSLGTCWCSR